MEVIFKDYKIYFFVFLVAFLIAFFEVLREVHIKEKTQRFIKKILGRVVFFKDKIRTYSSSSSSSFENLSGDNPNSSSS